VVITIFLLITILLTITDIQSYWIPNIVVIPAIIWGMMLTGNWLWALALFAIGTYFVNRKCIAGGDVKVIAMGGAFPGWLSIPVFILSCLIIRSYKKRVFRYTPLPCTPFFLIASVIIVATSKVIRWLIALPALTAGGA